MMALSPQQAIIKKLIKPVTHPFALLGLIGLIGLNAVQTVIKRATKLAVELAKMQINISALNVLAVKPKHNPVQVTVANGRK